MSSRTIVMSESGRRLIARSEATRLVIGLEGFREVILDFAGVEEVGQGFADEVFRVWTRTHPETRLMPTRMNEPVAFMVQRAVTAAAAEKR